MPGVSASISRKQKCISVLPTEFWVSFLFPFLLFWTVQQQGRLKERWKFFFSVHACLEAPEIGNLIPG